MVFSSLCSTNISNFPVSHHIVRHAANNYFHSSRGQFSVEINSGRGRAKVRNRCNPHRTFRTRQPADMYGTLCCPPHATGKPPSAAESHRAYSCAGRLLLLPATSTLPYCHTPDPHIANRRDIIGIHIPPSPMRFKSCTAPPFMLLCHNYADY